MRPLFIEINAFGAYADSESIDFSRLKDEPLLLIHGPTGSGKSTVLDAICFALFGDTSGDERTGQQMRSELADPDQLTQITFDFGFRDRVYRVRRSPGQHRPKTRGDGTTFVAHAASLWDRTGVDRDGDGEHMVSGSTRVGKKVEDLFGFSSQQFRQVVMLPQGQFRRLLMADSGEKEAILQKLFRTDLFERVTNLLIDRANTVKAQYKEKAAKATALLDHAGLESVELLEADVAGLEERRAVLEAKVVEAHEDLTLRRGALDAGLAVQRKLEEAQAAAVQLGQLTAQKGAVDAKRASLAAARRALPLVELLDGVKARRRDLEGAQKALAQAVAELAAADGVLARATIKLGEETAGEPARDAARARVVHLEALRQRVGDLEIAQREAAAAARAHDDVRGRLDVIEKKHKDTESALGERTDTLVAVQALSGQAAARRLEHHRAQEWLDRAKKLDVARKKVGVDQAAADAATASEKEAVQAFDLSRQELESLWALWRSGQAAVLARSLTDGEPCPVCGASDHPSPAAASSEIPSEEAIKGAKGVVERREAARDRAVAARGEAAAQLEASSAVAAELARTLQENGDADRAELAREAAALSRSLKEATDAEKALPGALDAVARAKEDLHKAKKAAEDLDRLCRAAQERLSTARAVAAERANEVPEALRRQGALDGALKTAADVRDELLRALEGAQAASRAAGEAAASARTARDKATDARANAAAALQAAQDGLAARRIDAGLADDTAFEAARIAVPEIGAFDEELRVYDAALAASTDRVARTSEAAEGLEPADVAALEAGVTEAAALHTGLVADAATCRSRHQARGLLLAEYRTALSDAAALDQEVRVLGGVSDVARGRGRNQRNMSFQRFVLAVLLDDVLLQASDRLHRMTEGRYRLVRSTVVAHKAKAAGLDLEVSDSYSGKTRAVATLSGGESFLAALALSLGLVDVVQGYSGGVQLDALFIDEGFGTLDGESLERAVEVLSSLNSGGRLIGIISHVAALKRRIGTRLEVIPTDRGSRTELIVA